jgi:mono/diheme cytochrome c family protein
MKRVPFSLLVFSLTLWAAPSRADEDIQALFHAKCASCHGDDGKGDTKWGRKYKAPNFTSAKFQDESKDSEFLETIEKGVTKKVKDDKTGEVKPKKIMPGWSEKLSEDQMKALVAYVRKFKS